MSFIILDNFLGLLKIISGLVHSVYSLKGKLENWFPLHPVHNLLIKINFFLK